jgi:hypothetical protein
VDENVFSYSNRSGQERALIIYNNSLNTTRGNIKNSVVFNAGGPGGEDLVQRTLVEGLGLNKGEDCYYIFKDHREKVEYLRRGSQIHEEGFVLELPGYQYRAFLEINEETDEDGSWRRLWENLQGRGVPDILLARRELVLAPLHQAAAGIFSGSLMRSLFIWESTGAEDNSEGMNRIQEALDELLRSAREQGLPGDSRQKLLEDIKSDADSLAILDRILGQGRVEGRVPDFLAEVYPPEEEDRSRFKSILMIWIILRRLETIFISGESLDTRKKWIDEWLLTPVITQGFMELGRDRYEAYLDTRLVRGMIVYQNLLASGSVAGLEKGLGELLNDPGLADYLSLNSHQGILWFSKERMEELIYWLFTAELFSGWQEHGFEGDDKAREILRYHKNLSLILDAASESGYKVREALEHVRQSSP